MLLGMLKPFSRTQSSTSTLSPARSHAIVCSSVRYCPLVRTLLPARTLSFARSYAIDRSLARSYAITRSPAAVSRLVERESPLWDSGRVPCWGAGESLVGDWIGRG